jgi:hypothetical protein
MVKAVLIPESLFLFLLFLNVVADSPEYRLSKPTAFFSAGDTTPSTPLGYNSSTRVCQSPRDWFPWDYEEPWNDHWSYHPMCTVPVHVVEGEWNSPVSRSKENTYCTFVSRDFAEGRGIAIFTSVHHAEAIVSRPAFADPESIQGINDLIDGQFDPPPYEKKFLPPKGYGLVANRTIFRGERIIQETAALIYDREAFQQLPDETRIPMQWHMMYQLPENTREELMALHVQDIGDQIDDVMRTNAFGGVYAEIDLHNNVFPRMSRFNHDCRAK